MKTTIVPAQVTTVEDKIAGSLGLVQLILLVAPIFVGGGVYALMPPFFGGAVYKIVLTVCVATIFCLFSIRIKDRIVLSWAMLLLQYNTRPRYYVFDKNDTHLRDIAKDILPEETTQQVVKPEVMPALLPSIDIAEIVKIERMMSMPEANLHFKTNRKGGLSVHITEVQ